MEGLICALCEEAYNMDDKRPKTLKCGHTFCLECLLRWFQKQNRIECPNDESKYYESVETLPDNQAIKNMLMDLEVRCPRHKGKVEEFCLTHLTLFCGQCPPHRPNCLHKFFVEDANEITNVLIKTMDDVFSGIPMPSPKLKDAYERRFKQKIAANIDLLYEMRDQMEALDSLKCRECPLTADSAFDVATFEGLCQTHNSATSTPSIRPLQGLSKDQVKEVVISGFKDILKNVNYCSLTLEDLNFLSTKSSARLDALQLFGKQLIAKSEEGKVDFSRLPDKSFCPKCKGVILKSSGEIYPLPCNSKLHAICQTCANELQGQVSVACPLDGLNFSEKGLQKMQGAVSAIPPPSAPTPAAMPQAYSPHQMYGSQMGFPANPPGGQYQVLPELANLGVAAQPIAPGSVLRPPGLPSGLPGGPGMNPYMSPPPFMSQSYAQGAPPMPQMPLYQSGFAPAMPPRSGPPAGFPPMPQGPAAGFAPIPQGPGPVGFPPIPQGPGFSSGMPPSSYIPGYNPLPGGPMYQSQYPAAGPQGQMANPQMFPQVPANRYSAAHMPMPSPSVAPMVPVAQVPIPATPSGSGSVPCSPLPPINVQGQFYLDRFPSVLPPSGLPQASMTGNNKGWHVNFQKNQVEAVTMTTFAPCVLTGIGLANPIQPGAVAIVESVSLFNGPFAYGRPVAEHQGGEQLVGGNSIISYVNFRTGFQLPEFTKMTLKVKIVCPPQQRVPGVDLYRGNPFERPDLWSGSDEMLWGEFEETIKVGEGEFVNGQNNLSGPILRFIYRR